MNAVLKKTLKAVGRGVATRLPFARESYFQWEFLRSPCGCKGIYPSFAEALQRAPPGKSTEHSDPGIASRYRGYVGRFNPGDQPMMPWLADILPGARSVFDLGGNIGLAYYAFRLCLPVAQELRWTVCEVPGVNQAGEQIALEQNATRLSFTEKRELAEGADLYVTFGALQYIEDPFSEIIGALRTKPRHILVNRVPLTEGRPFITLQNNIEWFFPYKVEGRAPFEQSITSLGYELVTRWPLDRSFSVFMEPQYRVDHYYGMYFRRL